jgi:hypothetical protein
VDRYADRGTHADANLDPNRHAVADEYTNAHIDQHADSDPHRIAGADCHTIADEHAGGHGY